MLMSLMQIGTVKVSLYLRW